MAKARGERTQSAMEQDKKNASGTGEKEDKGEMESGRQDCPKGDGAGRKRGRQPGVARKRTGLARRMRALDLPNGEKTCGEKIENVRRMVAG